MPHSWVSSGVHSTTGDDFPCVKADRKPRQFAGEEAVLLAVVGADRMLGHQTKKKSIGRELGISHQMVRLTLAYADNLPTQAADQHLRVLIKAKR